MKAAVLIVDDSPSARRMLSINLRAIGFSVDEASDGAEGYSKAILGAFDLIITDGNMPNMSGAEFIRRFRAHPSGRDVSIIFVSARSDEYAKREAKAAGAIGWLIKPFYRRQLLSEIKRVADMTCHDSRLGMLVEHHVSRAGQQGDVMRQTRAPLSSAGKLTCTQTGNAFRLCP
ncbi:response regulator [Phaeovulum sp.]|uniref:response regulator n=1 Tax=Phaeovulum sp. TaxID=2934796 RepID=UPI003565C5B5